MGNHDRSKLLQWACLLFVASTASATSQGLSLSDFEVITSSLVPISCILAYNRPVTGCSTGDFGFGRKCSAECVRGLNRAQSNLESACDGTSVPAASILGQVLQGNLVDLLCPGSSPVTTTSSAPTTAAKTSTRSVLTSQTTVRPTTSTTQSSTSATTTAIESDIPTFIPSSSPTPDTLTPTTFVPSSQPSPTSIMQVPSTSANSNSSPGPAEAPIGNGGGGSPFDVLASNDGSRRAASKGKWFQASSVAAILGLWLLLR
ncbi:hypothetical protein B0H63DRAFT_71688 [Podospora didyma]|uniref:Extracellular membrane protein CFEM domain-containing protein n=1 Tax=Podospora didyma TaxID=330526 RepID=A0AAE0N2X5_9PEZI|nr:hypothetical protein B0H63DRAFT_71688 [Podospora didyma]